MCRGAGSGSGEPRPQYSKFSRKPKIQTPEDEPPPRLFDQYCTSGIRLIPCVSWKRTKSSPPDSRSTLAALGSPTNAPSPTTPWR